jgi:hypothetical protein
VPSPGTFDHVFNLSDDEESVWRAAVSALRSKGASPSETLDGANLILAAYRRQRDGLASQMASTDEDDT